MKVCDKCNICSQRLLNYKTYLKCTICCESSHPKCNSLSKTEAEVLKMSTNWTCLACTKETFPFLTATLNLQLPIIITKQTAFHVLRYLGNKFLNVIFVITIFISAANLKILDVKNVEMIFSLHHVIFFPMVKLI